MQVTKITQAFRNTKRKAERFSVLTQNLMYRDIKNSPHPFPRGADCMVKFCYVYLLSLMRGLWSWRCLSLCIMFFSLLYISSICFCVMNLLNCL